MTTRDTGREGALGLDLDSLHAYLDHVLPDTRPAAARTITLLQGGRSNLSYRITGGGRDLVLRRPPLGDLLPTAHDMAREHRVQAALQAVGFPVAQQVVFCADREVIGAPFYLMEFVDGLILDETSEHHELDAAAATALSLRLMSALAELHEVDPAAAGLSSFGRPHGYLRRQVSRWVSQWNRSKTRELPELDEIARRLSLALPAGESAPTIVHGDFRLGNMIVGDAPDFPVRAVLDWELSTLGDPLADLGFTLAHWHPDGGPILGGLERLTLPDGGFLTRDEMVETYSVASGRDVSSIDFYLVLACFKTAVIFEGIHARHLARDTVGSGFDTAATSVDLFTHQALEVSARSSVPHLRG